jgi:hypothetical protein
MSSATLYIFAAATLGFLLALALVWLLVLSGDDNGNLPK